MAEHVYHWKHGWIPLDHAAAKEPGVMADTRDPASKPKEHRTAADNKVMIDRGVQMHGSDRARWSLVNLKAAAQMGDAQSKTELAKRIAKTKRR